MREQETLRRPHPRLLVIRTLHVLRSAWVVAGLGAALYAVLPSGWRILLMVVGGYYVYTRAFQIFYDFAAVRYSADARGLFVVRGIVGREEKHFGWESIVTITVTQTLLQRMLSVADVRVVLDAAEVASETIPGTSVTEAARLVRLHAALPGSLAAPGVPSPSALEATASPSATSGVITPVLAPTDFFLIGVYSGAFLLFVPSAYSVAAEVRAMFGFPSAVLPSVRDLAAVEGGALGASLLAVVLLSFLYGTSVAWVRYRGFAVALHPNGELAFRAGWASRERRVIAPDAVVAFELRRPILMAPVRRAFLRAVVRGDTGHVTRGMLLPLVRSSQGVDVLCRITDLPRRTLSSRPRSGVAVASMAAVIGIFVVGVGLVMQCKAVWAVVAAPAAALLLRAVDASIGSVRIVTTAAANRWIVADRGLLFRSTWVISAPALDVSRWCGISRRHGVLTINVRGRRTSRLHVWPTSARRALQLRCVGDPRTPISLERSPR